MQNIAIFGATGSIGGSTLDVLTHYPDRYRVFALTANSRLDELTDLCERFNPQIALVADASKKTELAQKLAQKNLSHIEVWGGETDLVRLAALPEVDVAVLAIVGAAGLAPTFSAARAGKRLLLANKESVVCGGALLMQTIRDSKAELLPVDSEHNAIFQCLASADEIQRSQARIILTASGGPFRKRMDLTGVTPEDAVAHPTWNMGKKITVDSATMMNKGLEIIEAHHLFNMDYDDIQVVIHPQSIVHSAIEYKDGSVIAQLGLPSMHIPIQYAISYPERFEGIKSKSFSFVDAARLDFEKPDYEKFPAVELAYLAGRTGGTATACLNAANEEAVFAFLEGKIKLYQIYEITKRIFGGHEVIKNPTIDEIFAVDAEIRRKTKELILTY